MTDYVTDFVEESREHITELNNWLLELERSPESEEAIEEIFRIAHTLKGNCGAMGLTAASDLAHAIEDLLEAVRSGDIEVSPDIMDTVFAGVDNLETMVEEVATHGETRTDPTETIEALGAHTDIDVLTPSDEEIERLLEDLERPGGDLEGYVVRLSLEGSQHENDGKLVVDALVDAFDLLDTDPPRDRLEGAETVDAVFATPVETEAIAAALEGVDILSAFEIVPVTDRFDGDETAELEEERAELTSEEAEELSVDELLSEFDEFDDLDAAVEDVGDVDAFDDMGEAGSFDDLLSSEDFEKIDDEVEDELTDSEEATEAESAEDKATLEDSNAVFNELKDEVEMVEFDELQSELEELEFDEFDEEVGMDELLEDAGFEDDDDDLGIDEQADDLEIDEQADDLGIDEQADDLEIDEQADDLEIDEQELASAESFDDGEDAFEFVGDLEPAVPDEEDDVEEDTNEDDGGLDEVTADTLDSDFGDDEAEYAIGEATSDDANLEIEDIFDHAPSSDLEFEDEPADLELEDAFETPAEGQSAPLEDDEGHWEVPADDVGGFEPAEAGFDPTADLEEIAFGEDDESASEREESTVEPIEIPDITVPDLEESPEPESEGETERIQSVRINADQIDTLLTLVEGLVTSRVRLRHAIDSGADLRTIDRELDDLEDIASDLQSAVVDVQLVPLETVTGRLPRVVRDIARDQGKDVDFEIMGEEVELDRTILERIGDPLIHLVRNAVDHGIELPEEREAAEKPPEGSVELRAERERDRIVIEISDDGRGLDPDSLRSAAVDADVLTEAEAEGLPTSDVYDLVFHPGLSTADEVTDVSGRGVGMDVVKRTIDDLEGTITVESDPGEGTTVTLTVPVTVAISDVLFVESGDEEFGIPAKVVEDVEAATVVEADDDWSTVNIDDETLPVVDLAETLDTSSTAATEERMVVRVREDVRQVVLQCDDISDQREVVIKPFEGFMSDIPGLSGATVRGRGKVVNILDVKTL